MVGEDSSVLIPKLIICLIAAASAAVVVTIYHCITAGHIRALFCGSRSTNSSNSLRSFTSRLDETQQSSAENSLANLIPSHKYKKGSGLSTKQDGMCPICISDFEDGEEIRTLPECLHSYHVPCIDMWLYSHSNCPMCRTNAAPSSLMLMQMLENANPEMAPPVPPPVLQQQRSNISV